MPADIYKAISLSLIIVIGLTTGCEPQSTNRADPSDGGELAKPIETGPGQENGPRVRPDLTAKAILQAVVDRYRSARSYRDSGVLHLSYVLKGQPIQEPKRWATTFRNDGHFALDAFNTKLRGDGRTLTCEIFDIESANMDNQNMVIPYSTEAQSALMPPLEKVFRDQIAKHFVCGFSEVPLEARYEAKGPWLIPPAVSLLTGRVANPWLQGIQQAERKDDQVVDQKRCFVIRIRAEKLTADVWVDQATLAVVQMSLPHKFLADEVVTSNQVSDVVFVAKFHDAEFDQEIEDSVFRYSPRDEAVFVRKFVALPEPLPSGRIGKSAPAFVLRTPNGAAVDRQEFAGKTTVLVWLSQPTSGEVAEQLKSVVDAASGRTLVGLVYSDSDTAEPGSGRAKPSSAIDSLGKQLEVPVFYDKQYAASSRLELESIPAAVVLGGDLTVQYVQPLVGESWAEKLTAAVTRVQSGDNVAGEMRDAYADYLDTYHQQLASVSAVNLVDASLRENNAQPQQGSNLDRFEINPRKVWANQDFKRPGNVVSIVNPADQSIHYAILDGVQSVGLVDEQGRLIEKKKPASLGSDETITKLRSAVVGDKLRLAAFAVMGESYLVLDERLGDLRPRKPGGKILDLQWFEADGNDRWGVLYSTDTAVEFCRIGEQAAKRITGGPASSLAAIDRLVLGVTDGRIVEVGSFERDFAANLNYVRVVSGGEQCVGVGQNNLGKWTVVGFDKAGQRLWTLATGPHLHESFVDPIASGETNDGTRIWAIADSDNVIHLIAGDGQWLGEFLSKQPVEGLWVQNVNGRMHLIVCSSDGILCWDLNLTESNSTSLKNNS